MPYELRDRAIYAYGGKCMCCPEKRSTELNIIMFGGTDAQRREYRAMKPNSRMAFLYNRYYPSTHSLICAKCVREHGGFGVVADHPKLRR